MVSVQGRAQPGTRHSHEAHEEVASRRRTGGISPCSSSPLGLGFATCAAFDSQLLGGLSSSANLLAIVFMLPTCTILAISNLGLALNVVSPFLARVHHPRKADWVMDLQGLTFQSLCSDKRERIR